MCPIAVTRIISGYAAVPCPNGYFNPDVDHLNLPVWAQLALPIEELVYRFVRRAKNSDPDVR